MTVRLASVNPHVEGQALFGLANLRLVSVKTNKWEGQFSVRSVIVRFRVRSIGSEFHLWNILSVYRRVLIGAASHKPIKLYW